MELEPYFFIHEFKNVLKIIQMSVINFVLGTELMIPPGTKIPLVEVSTHCC